MRIIKRLFKALLWLLLLLIIVAAVFVALNQTMVRNMMGMKNMRADNVSEWQKPRVAVPGRLDDSAIQFQRPEALSAQTRDKILDYHHEKNGLGMVVWIDGGIALEDYADGLNGQSHTASYSMNKSVTALVAATLDADGILPLDTRAGDFLAEWDNDPRGDITLRQLLQHTTPLAFKSMSSPDFKTLEILIGDDIEKAALKHPLADKPVVFDYATINYQVAGAIIRRAIRERLKMSYPEYLSQKIWQPIGAGDVYLSSGTEGGIPRFYAGLQAGLQDWLKLGVMILQNGELNGQQIVPQAAINTLLTPAASNSAYGLGIWLGGPADGTREYGPSTKFSVPHSAPYLANDVVFFDGFGGQRVYIVPSAGLVIVRTGQPDFSFDDSVLVNLVLAERDELLENSPKIPEI